MKLCSFISLVVLVVYSFCICSAEYQSSKKDELKERIFGQNGSALKPEETHELLKQLVEIDDQSDKNLSYQIRSLVAAGTFSIDKCKWEQFLKINIGSPRDAIAAEAIKPYLNFCAEEQFKLCEDKFLADLKEAVGGLSESDRKDLDRLDTNVIDSSNKYARMNIGIISSNALYTGLQRISKKSATREHVGPNCRRINDRAKKAASVYLVNKDRMSIVDRYDEFVIIWVPRITLCSRILMMNENDIVRNRRRFK